MEQQNNCNCNQNCGCNLEYVKVHTTKDESGHWYVIPYTLKEEFNSLLEKLEDDYDYEGENEFIEKFDKYRIGGDLNLIQLYIRGDYNLVKLYSKE